MIKSKHCSLRVILTALVVTAIFAVMPITAYVAPTASAQTLTPIDVYIISGQSNAAGCSRFVGTPKTYDNILMAGKWEEKLDGSANFSMLTYDSMRPVTAGFGRDTGYIGPEYGMAEVLKDSYSADNKAIFFKYATGGTRLLDTIASSGIDQTAGTWYPSSLQDSSLHAGMPQNGGMYNGAMDAFEVFVNSLNDNGYQPKIKAIVWMQGEADRDNPTAYKRVFKTFARDFRADLTARGALDADSAIFTIGEISESFYSADAANKSINLGFIAAQNELAGDAEVMPAVCVDSSGLDINGANGEVYGSDKWHWNGDDMETLGQRFGSAIVQNLTGNYVICSTSGNGKGTVTASKKFFETGETITITVTPDESALLQGLTVNGVDKLGELSDGQLVIPNASGEINVAAAFSRKTMYPMSFEGAYIAKFSTPFVHDGGTAFVRPDPPAGKEVDTVTFTPAGSDTSVAMTYNAEKKRYEYSGVTSAGKITVTYKDKTAAAPDTDAPEKKGGCANAATTVFALLSTLAVGLFILKR